MRIYPEGYVCEGCADRGSVLKLKRRHRWFSHYCLAADDGFYGPHKTIEAAISEVICAHGADETGPQIYVFQGYKMTKAERDEWGAEFDWQCDTHQHLTFLRPNGRDEPRP